MMVTYIADILQAVMIDPTWAVTIASAALHWIKSIWRSK